MGLGLSGRVWRRGSRSKVSPVDYFHSTFLTIILLDEASHCFYAKNATVSWNNSGSRIASRTLTKSGSITRIHFNKTIFSDKLVIFSQFWTTCLFDHLCYSPTQILVVVVFLNCYLVLCKKHNASRTIAPEIVFKLTTLLNYVVHFLSIYFNPFLVLIIKNYFEKKNWIDQMRRSHGTGFWIRICGSGTEQRSRIGHKTTTNAPSNSTGRNFCHCCDVSFCLSFVVFFHLWYCFLVSNIFTITLTFAGDFVHWSVRIEALVWIIEAASIVWLVAPGTALVCVCVCVFCVAKTNCLHTSPLIIIWQNRYPSSYLCDDTCFIDIIYKPVSSKQQQQKFPKSYHATVNIAYVSTENWNHEWKWLQCGEKIPLFSKIFKIHLKQKKLFSIWRKIRHH